MAFNSLEYAVFFGFVFVVFWALRNAHAARTAFLVVASAFFYTRFDYGPTHPHLGAAYLALLFSSATIDFYLASAIYRADLEPNVSPASVAAKRRRLLVVSLVYNLGVLAWFKYTGFAVDNVCHLLAAMHVHVSPHTVRTVLPIGISFFTFETMSYTIDVYRRELTPSKSFLEYLLFISFFPHLVAGPIIRPKGMLPQLRARPSLSRVLSGGGRADEGRGAAGLFLIADGLLKKIAIADYLALNHVDRVFDRPELFSAPEALAGVYGYAIQIYCDFSGYTDIAIGSALLLGFVLPKNFDAPYTARNLQDFWRRWHISLSSWLRDYLYIPLGGLKGPAWKTYRNLLLTMLLGGLWHGASWNFVLWGAMHGVALAATRMWQRSFARPESVETGSGARVLLSRVLTFHYVCLAWVFFRADGFSRAVALLRQVAFGGARITNLSRGVVLVLAVGFISHFIPRRVADGLRDQITRWPAPAQGGLLFAFALFLREVATTQVVPFVYFQF